MRQVQATQIVAGKQARDLDVISAHSEAGVHCVTLLMIRGGRVLGSRALFPKVAGAPEPGELLEAFITQHYFELPAPSELLVTTPVESAELLSEVLTSRAGHRVEIRHRVRGTRRRWLEMATENARESARLRLAANAGLGKQFAALGEVLGLEAPPERIECFDISHTGGESTVASCVVWNSQGPVKSDYRRYNIREAGEGDDYGAMTEVVRRRYLRVQRGEAPVPDLVLIDGGPGQLRAAHAALEELQFPELPLVGVAKGAGRKPGREQLHRLDQAVPLRLAADSPALHLVQQVRDEAHRFAITGHRQQRGRARHGSALDQVAGVGPQRRRALLQRFGGLQGLKRANVEDLASVRGISRDLAATHFRFFSRRHRLARYHYALLSPCRTSAHVSSHQHRHDADMAARRGHPAGCHRFLPARALGTSGCRRHFHRGCHHRRPGRVPGAAPDLTSEFGAFLDPVADKLMVVIVLVLILQNDPRISIAAIAAIIIGREVMVSALREWMAEMGDREQRGRHRGRPSSRPSRRCSGCR